MSSHTVESQNEAGSNAVERDNGCWSCLKACGLCCYIGCPPIPSMITNKISFHPLPKGESYTLHIVGEPDVKVHHAKQLIGKEFTIQQHSPPCPATDADFRRVLRNVTTFVVQTSRKHHLIGIKCSPSPKARKEALANKCVIFSQPNSSDLGRFLHPMCMSVSEMAEFWGVDVYAFDYSGYGYSSGSPSELNVYDDIKTIYDYVRYQDPAKKIILLGYSLGTSVVTHLAHTNPEALAGVILIAPFSSGIRLFGNYPDDPKTKSCDRFNTYDRISSIECPVLICHGTHDAMITPDHGQALFSRLKQPVPPLLLYGADHSTILNGAFPQTFIRINRFINFETGTISSEPTSNE